VAQKIRNLSKSGIERVQALSDSERKKVMNGGRAGMPPDDVNAEQYLTPEVYMGRVTGAGIWPAQVLGTPVDPPTTPATYTYATYAGDGEVDVYQVVPEFRQLVDGPARYLKFEPVGVRQRALNASFCPVHCGAWVVVTRDKAGNGWWIEPPAGFWALITDDGSVSGTAVMEDDGYPSHPPGLARTSAGLYGFVPLTFLDPADDVNPAVATGWSTVPPPPLPWLSVDAPPPGGLINFQRQRGYFAREANGKWVPLGSVVWMTTENGHPVFHYTEEIVHASTIRSPARTASSPAGRAHSTPTRWGSTRSLPGMRGSTRTRPGGLLFMTVTVGRGCGSAGVSRAFSVTPTPTATPRPTSSRWARRRHPTTMFSCS
jgi:hypothetical protein